MPIDFTLFLHLGSKKGRHIWLCHFHILHNQVCLELYLRLDKKGHVFVALYVL